MTGSISATNWLRPIKNLSKPSGRPPNSRKRSPSKSRIVSSAALAMAKPRATTSRATKRRNSRTGDRSYLGRSASTRTGGSSGIDAFKQTGAQGWAKADLTSSA